MDLLKKREERAKMVRDARALFEHAEKETRDMTADEQGQYDKLLAAADVLERKIDQAEKLEEREKRFGVIDSPASVESGDVDASDRRGKTPDAKEHRATAFRKWIREGDKAVLTPDEQRALQADSNTAGGYLVPPEQFVAELIKAIDNEAFIRGLATKHTVISADSLGAPVLDANPSDCEWTTELATGNADTAMTIGKRELKPHPMAKRILVSNKLLRVSAINVDSLVAERLGYVCGITEEKAFLTGTGAGQPLGVFTASGQGVSTARDVSTGNTTTTIEADGLKECKYSLKGAYHKKATWVFHRTAVKQLAKLKDGEGRYLWQPSIVLGSPDMLEGMPLKMSEYAPNTFETGLYVGILGDFSMYWIVDALTFQIQRLVELYAATNQTGFICRAELDGMPVWEEAFARVKLA